MSLSTGIYLIFPLLFAVIVVDNVNSLNCYICGEGNLGEFGDCNKQFQYGCSNYAQRFPQGETIYCRTARHTEANGTYTIMKECISETDHRKTFPQKNLRIIDECDVVDIDGKEIAYCLCRSTYCNQKSINDQFLAFEERYPELFHDTDEEATIQTVSSIPIEPVNQPVPTNKAHTPDASRRVTISMSDRKQQLALGAPTAELSPAPINNGQIRVGQLKNLSTEEESSWNAASQGSFAGQLEPRNNAEKGSFGHTSNVGVEEMSRTKSENALKCMQCAQGTLKDEKGDCDKQAIITCDTPSGAKDKNYCLTRQVLIGEGKNAVEKMCITNKSLVNIFAGRVAPNQCTELLEENVRICICDTPLCNRESIYKQILPGGTDIQNSIVPVPKPMPTASTPTNAVLKRCYVCSENDLESEGEDCLRPITVDCGRQVDYQADTYCLTRQTELSKGVFSLEKLCVTERQFQEDFPEENGLRQGCFEMFDGMIKYCVCDGDLCNQQSLAVQLTNDPNYVRNNIVTSTEPSLTVSKVTKHHQTSAIIQPGSAVRRTSANDDRQPNDISQSLFKAAEKPTEKTQTDISSNNDADHSALKAKLQESLLNERQNRWKQKDSERWNNSAKAAALHSFSASFLALLFTIVIVIN